MRSKLRLFGRSITIFLGLGKPVGVDGQTILDLAGTGTTIFLGGLFRGGYVNSYFLGTCMCHIIFGYCLMVAGGC